MTHGTRSSGTRTGEVRPHRVESTRPGELGPSTACSRHTRNPKHKGPLLSGGRPAQRPKAATRATAAQLACSATPN